MTKNSIMINNDKFGHSYLAAQVIDEDNKVIRYGIIGVSFSFMGIIFQNIFMWYNPQKNVFENENEQPIIIVYEYISPDQVYLFKKNKRQKEVFITRSNYTCITFVEVRKKVGE